MVKKDGMNVVAIATNEVPVGINAIILNDKNQILLGLRAGHRGGAGTWGLIGGKARTGEPIEHTCIREVKEEVGLTVKEKDLKVINMFTTQSTPKYLFFQIGVLVKKWKGIPKNMEPDRCDEIRFFDLDKLPENLFMGTKGNIDLFLKSEFYNKEANYDYRNVSE